MKTRHARFVISGFVLAALWVAQPAILVAQSDDEVLAAARGALKAERKEKDGELYFKVEVMGQGGMKYKLEIAADGMVKSNIKSEPKAEKKPDEKKGKEKSPDEKKVEKE